MFIAAFFVIIKTGNNLHVKQQVNRETNSVYSHNGILLSNENKWTVAICNMDESQNKYAKWKRSDKNEYILCIFDTNF